MKVRARAPSFMPTLHTRLLKDLCGRRLLPPDGAHVCVSPAALSRCPCVERLPAGYEAADTVAGQSMAGAVPLPPPSRGWLERVDAPGTNVNGLKMWHQSWLCRQMASKCQALRYQGPCNVRPSHFVRSIYIQANASATLIISNHSCSVFGSLTSLRPHLVRDGVWTRGRACRGLNRPRGGALKKKMEGVQRM